MLFIRWKMFCLKRDNGHYLSVDLGLHNLMTCYDNAGKLSLLGENIFHFLYFITRKSRESSRNGIGSRQHGKWSIRKHPGICRSSIEKENNRIKDYIHKMTRYITNYCVKNDIHTVVIGDIKGS